MKEIYTENILDHYKYPRNKGSMKNPDASYKESNPLCGDVLEFQIKVEKGVIKEIMFSGTGCAVSQASASMLSEIIKGKDLEFAKALSNEDIYKMLGIDLTPSRTKCALLSLKALKMAIYDYLGEKDQSNIY